VSETKITPLQRRGLIAAWLGWAFDGLDGYLYIIVASRFVRQLLEQDKGTTVTMAEVAAKAAIIQGFFLIGWALGGAVFGRIGDHIGRSKTLMLTVLTYAVFTGMSFFAEAWWHLLIFRFIAALGIGGEWAAGSALVNETLHRKHRTWASATLQSGYMLGCIAAALTGKLMANLEPRWVFVVGVLPALLTLWIRRAVPEPEAWAREAAKQKPPPVSALFGKGLLHITLLISALTSIALTTVWAFLYFAPQAAQQIPEAQNWTAPQKQTFASNIAIYYFAVNIAANYAATYLAALIGYRKTFALFLAGAMASFLIGFARPLTLDSIYIVYGFTAFFALGLFGLFPFYIPPLFPTLVRTLGAGFTYNIGRIFSSIGAFAGGWIAASAGGPAAAIWWTGFLYIPGVLVALFIPEVKEHKPGTCANCGNGFPPSEDAQRGQSTPSDVHDADRRCPACGAPVL
jgi:MFS family permease